MPMERKQLVGAEDVGRMVRRLAVEILERVPGSGRIGLERTALVAIRTGGEPLAQRLAALIQDMEGRALPVGAVDITLYRDDAAVMLPDPKIGPSEIDFEIEGRDVVLVDDVLQSGRTVRAAIDCLLDFGRPRRIWLAVLCDRGGRELPIAPDFIGRTVEVAEDDMVVVRAQGEASDGVFVDHSEREEAGP